MKVLFVAYGGGHIEMCLPVIKALREKSGHVQIQIMALTTGYQAALSAGESPIGYKDFSQLYGKERIEDFAKNLLDGNSHPAVSEEETIAYLGINFHEWREKHGMDKAQDMWKQYGRRGFYPISFFLKILEKLKPDVVVTTNSPRSEQAAVEAAVEIGIPCLSMVDLFALKDDSFVKRNLYADRITVLANSTKKNLISAGIAEEKILVTGNPAFDALQDNFSYEAAMQWKIEKGWQNKKIILWAGHKEPAFLNGRWSSETQLGQDVQSSLVNWVLQREDTCLIIRYHPNEWQDFQPPQPHQRVYWSIPGEDPLLRHLLCADQVVVQATTVGVQAYAAGKRVIGLSFSPTVQQTGMYARDLGFGCSVENIEDLILELEKGCEHMECGMHSVAASGQASQLIADEIIKLGNI